MRKQYTILTTEATYLPVFHKMPGSQENFDKNHTRRQTVAGPQMPWWLPPRTQEQTVKTRKWACFEHVFPIHPATIFFNVYYI